MVVWFLNLLQGSSKNIISIVSEALKAALVDKKELDAIAYTRGPD